ncbi:hypothetical protein Dimus_000415 [Dionaea muscipula]
MEAAAMEEKRKSGKLKWWSVEQPTRRAAEPAVPGVVPSRLIGRGDRVSDRGLSPGVTTEGVAEAATGSERSNSSLSEQHKQQRAAALGGEQWVFKLQSSEQQAQKPMRAMGLDEQPRPAISRSWRAAILGGQRLRLASSHLLQRAVEARRRPPPPANSGDERAPASDGTMEQLHMTSSGMPGSRRLQAATRNPSTSRAAP